MPTTRSASATESSNPLISLSAETKSKANYHHSSHLDTALSEPPAKKRRADVVHGNGAPQVDQKIRGQLDGVAEQLPTVQELNADAPEPSLQLEEPSFEDAQLSILEHAPSKSPSQSDIGLRQAASDALDDSARLLQYAALGAAAGEALNASRSMAPGKTGSRMRVESLPILDNLSIQVLSKLAKSSYQEVLAMMREPDSEPGQEFAAVRSLFDHTKRVYTSTSPFLSPAQLDLTEATQVEILRKANLATFVSSLFGSQEIGFAELNDHFLEIFVPENGRLLKAQGSLFLDLKTQAFISSMNAPGRSKIDSLYTLFPDDLEFRILARRPGARNLAPSEQDFVKRASSRRDILQADITNPEALNSLPAKYHWDDFLRDVSSYVSKNSDALNIQQVSNSASSRVASRETKDYPQQKLLTNFPVTPYLATEPIIAVPKQEDFVAKAARAAQIALQGHNISIPAPGLLATPPPPQAQPRQSNQSTFQIDTNFQQYTPPTQSPHPPSSRSAPSPSYGPLPALPHVTQTAPTQVLYERARQATTTKSASPTTHRAGILSQRRPWTTEEENALMAGLDRVRGPHWSQILAMFGPGGTINESLKDRNQVQLKDKARNLKLFFLKSGIEVPYYLKYVTGDLKSRAPGQASKHEARERERLQGEEDKAHYGGVQGIMALAGRSQPPESQHFTPQQQVMLDDNAGALSELQRFQLDGQGSPLPPAPRADAPPNTNGGVEEDPEAVNPSLEGIPDLPPLIQDDPAEAGVGDEIEGMKKKGPDQTSIVET